MHERPRQRELLLLAAAQRPGRLPAPPGEDRKAPQHALAVGLDAGTVPSHVRAEAEVLLHGQLGERAAALGHVRDTCSRDRLRVSRQPLAREDDLAAGADGRRDGP